MFNTVTKIQQTFIDNVRNLGVEKAIEELKKLGKPREFSCPEILFIENESKDESAVLEFSESLDFSNSIKVPCHDNRFSIENLKINKTYYYKINGSKIRSFKTKDADFRFINIDGLKNVRDLGGKNIKQGLIYRGCELSPRYRLTEKGKSVFLNELKIKTELDLRLEAVGVQNKCVASDRVSYVQLPYVSYSGVFEEKYMKTLCEIMYVFAEKENYPIYFHCRAGADRTGMIAIFLRALAGEREEDIFLDYEVTSLSSVPDENGLLIDTFRHRHTEDFSRFLKPLEEYAPNKSLNEKIVNFLQACGVSMNCINKILRIIKK